MFNLYQHMKQNGDGKEQKEPETTGHDRFYQERSRSSFRKKKRRGCRRAQSAAELNADTIAVANRRNAFRIRSVSTDKEESEEENSEKAPLVAQKIDSLAKLLFNKSIMSGSGRSSPSESPSDHKQGEMSMEASAALSLCTEYLSYTPRYELICPLNAIGSRADKHWFAVHDRTIKTDRLLTLMPLSPGSPAPRPRVVLQLFAALRHPYVYPALDAALVSGHALVVAPFNACGSLKDVIYKSTWSDEYARKYTPPGTPLPPAQAARFARQLLEGLAFLRDKRRAPFAHLHCGNVCVQNGVARICGLELTLTGAAPHHAAPAARADELCLGHVLHEMCAAAPRPPAPPAPAAPAALGPEYAQAAEVIDSIFGPRPPTLNELLMCDLFRKIDLREMKGSCLPNFNQRLSRSCLSLLDEVSRAARSPATPPARRRQFPEHDYTEEWQWGEDPRDSP